MEKFKMRAMLLSSLGLMLLVVGVSYSFFNYTRTGSENNVRTGRIYFNTSEGDTINLTNLFPMTSEDPAVAELDTVTVGIVGDTTYVNGEEFEITFVDVNNTVNGKEVPITFIATYTATSGGTIGSSSDTYFTSRESKDATIYKLNTTGLVREGKQVLVGYIDNGATGISGTLTIKAYVDGSRVAISDTYPSGDIYEVPSNLSSEQVSACMSMFSDVNPTEAFCRGTGTVTGLYGNQVTLVELIDELRLGTAYINYMLQTGLIQVIGENGTTEQWTNGRTVLTTAEWNSLASNPLSFKIKAESNEGIWTTTQIDSCIGCKFLYQDIDVEDSSTYLYTTWNYGGESGGYPVQVTPSTLTTGLYDNYLDLVNTTGKNYFLGVKLNSNNQPTNAYACGIKDGTPFCIEGSLYEGLGGTNTTAIYTRNSTTLRTQNVFGSACTIQIQSHPYEPRTVSTKCETSSLKAKAIDIGTVGVGLGNSVCLVNTFGYFGCTDDYPSGD